VTLLHLHDLAAADVDDDQVPTASDRLRRLQNIPDEMLCSPPKLSKFSGSCDASSLGSYTQTNNCHFSLQEPLQMVHTPKWAKPNLCSGNQLNDSMLNNFFRFRQYNFKSYNVPVNLTLPKGFWNEHSTQLVSSSFCCREALVTMG